MIRLASSKGGDFKMAKSPGAALSAYLGDMKFGTVLADPPWRFANRTGKIAPEHRRLSRYGTLAFDEIAAMPIADPVVDRAHCYLWVPNALLPWGYRCFPHGGSSTKPTSFGTRFARMEDQMAAGLVFTSGT